MSSCLNVAFSAPGVLPWYGIRTKSNQEKTTATILAAKGYEQYLPMYQARRHWTDRTVDVSLPLFPGYVFCRFDAKRRLPIVSTPGVVCIIGFGAEPAPIPDAEVEAIQNVLSSGFSPEPCPYLQEGQRIRVKSGPLKGLEGILQKKKSEYRLVVSVAMLQRSICVEIDRDHIATA